MPYAFLLTVCFKFITAKFISKVVSDSETLNESPKMSEIISPLFCISGCFSSLVVVFANSPTVLVNSRILAKVSIIAKVVFVACSLLSIVASIYSPFSVNALIGADECFNGANR